MLFSSRLWSNWEREEAAPLIERAYAQGYVDPIVMGDWEDVQIEMGLKSAEEIAPTQANMWSESLRPLLPLLKPFTSASPQVTHKHKAAQKKAKSKTAKLSRKKNRKR